MGDDAELMKAAAQGVVEGAVSPIANIIQDIFGPASKSLGLALNERVKRFTDRTKEMLAGRAIDPKEISLTLLIPIIQNGAVEENAELQDRWAALLVNTAVTENELPAAPEILKQLTPLDVGFLQMCYEHTLGEVDRCNHESQPFHISLVEVTDTFEEWKRAIETRYGIHPFASGKHHPPEWALTEGNVIRLGLVKERLTSRKHPDHNDAALMMTELGYRFIGLCQACDLLPKK